MDNTIAQQLSYATLMFNMWLPNGSSLWEVSGLKPFDTKVDVGGKIVTGSELDDQCAQWKREGRYAEAIGGYLRSFDASYKKNGKLPISTLRGFIKVLIAANEFWFAFGLCGTAFADLQQRSDANQQEVYLFGGYWQDLCLLSQMIIDKNDFSQLYGWCQGYSGSQCYRMVKSNEDIRLEFKKIRDQYRSVYGK